jgi:DNA-binding transcriptional MerR regulator
MTIDIGQVTRAAGLPASTLHVWERRGLITPIERCSGRRQYDDSIMDRIAIIILLQRSGFHLDEIASLLAPDAFADGKEMLARKAEELRERHRHLDRAIEGIEHALHCPEPSPLECPGFLAHLDGVLPVEADERPRVGN